MGINSETDLTASLQIGPTDHGMVRIYVNGDGVDLPMDFEPDEAQEIADEIKAAIVAARALKTKKKKR
jgi:phage tail sheath gpL-like